MTSLGATTAFLSASTLSALSNASSSVTEPIDLELVEEIIDRAPRSATSFPLVYRAYGQVLEEHGLSASTDTAYYQFLLKLGVIRAPTWGEKWDLYKTTQTIASRSSPRKTNRSKSSSRAHTRSRVPFLASASSDLDEGYGEDTVDGDGESLIHHTRPSPRKVLQDRSRSLVGYTPSVSVDYEILTLNPPIRTSTPIYAQEAGRSTPPLPPYSVSDVSEIIDTSKNDDPSTPKAYAHNVEEKPMDERLEREMEERADQFYRTGLMGRCWDVWIQSYDWVKRTTDQIDHVRKTILLRQTFERWHEAHERLLSLPGTADRHRQIHLQARALKVWAERLQTRQLEQKEADWVDGQQIRDMAIRWKHWRNRVIQRRTERWKKDVAKKERAFVKARNSQIVSEIFNRWYDKMRDQVDGKTADQYYIQTTLQQAFDFWLRRAVLERKLEQAHDAKEGGMLQRVFTVWARQSRLGDVERQVGGRNERTLLGRVWDRWRIELRLSREARQFDQARLLSMALHKWKSRSQTLLSVESTAKHHYRTLVLRKTLRTWMTKERGQLFERVRENRLQSHLLHRWRCRRTQITVLERQGDELSYQLSQNSLHRHFSQWRARVGGHHQKLIQAVLYHEALELARAGNALLKWKDTMDRVKANQVTAEKARAFFAQRLALRVWKARFRLHEQEKYVESKRIAETRLWFDAWKLRTKQSQQDTKTLNTFHAQQKQRIMAMSLVKWTARVVEIKSREHDVIKQRNVQTRRNAFLLWRTALHRIKDAQALMQSFEQVRTDELLRKLFHHWRHDATRRSNLRIQSERSVIERDARLLNGYFAVWREKLRERGMKDIEQEVADRHEDALMFAVWDKWKARSSKLPEIAFAKRRILSSAWDSWCRAMDRRQKEMSVVVPREQQLLLDVFAVWREVTRRKLALHASRRRGRVRPSLGDPKRSSTRSPLPPMPSITAPLVPLRVVPRSHRRVTMNLPIRPDRHNVEEVESVSSEPAYSRLRSELYGRRRGGSEEPGNRRNSSGSGSSELVRQLRGTLGR